MMCFLIELIYVSMLVWIASFCWEAPWIRISFIKIKTKKPKKHLSTLSLSQAIENFLLKAAVIYLFLLFWVFSILVE